MMCGRIDSRGQATPVYPQGQAKVTNLFFDAASVAAWSGKCSTPLLDAIGVYPQGQATATNLFLDASAVYQQGHADKGNNFFFQRLNQP